MTDEKYEILRNYALKLISFRLRSVAEVQKKLLGFSAKRSFPAGLVQKVIDGLVSINLINDEEFAKWWLEQRQEFKPKGVRALKMELQYKGIGREIIEKVLDGNVKDNEFESAQSLIQKKLHLWRNFPVLVRKKKISGLLQRRGFSWEVIYKVIDSIDKKD